MLVVGLTGGIGSGKSIVAQLFAAVGVPVIDADLITRELTEPHQQALAEIVRHFGASILNEKGELNRSKLRSLIFNNPNERIWLEQLLHPLVIEEMERQISRLNTPYCIAVIPLLFETTAKASFIKRILVVDAPIEAQIERVHLRDKMQKDDILSILKTQATRQDRLSRADDIILNDGLIADLESQVALLHKYYTSLVQNIV